MRSHLLAAIWAAGALAIWLVLASRNPTLTYHFAPLIVGGAWAVARSPAGRRDAAVAAAGGTALAVAGTIALAIGDSLRGPDLVGGDAATVEAVVFALVGGTIGYLWARRPVPAATG